MRQFVLRLAVCNLYQYCVVKAFENGKISESNVRLGVYNVIHPLLGKYAELIVAL